MNRDGIFRANVISFDASSGECSVIAPTLFGTTPFSAKAATNNVGGLTARSQGDTVWVFFPGGDDTYPYWFTM